MSFGTSRALQPWPAQPAASVRERPRRRRPVRQPQGVLANHPPSTAPLVPDLFVYADHRSKVNYDLNKVLEGGLEESVSSMAMLDQQEMLKELMEEAA